MSRDWFAVKARTIRLPKFRRLGESAQLSLFYVWSLAGDEDVEATWSSREALSELLELVGRPAADLDDLIANGWLDLARDGSVSCHDWDDHQWAATVQSRNRWQAHHMREWRASKRRGDKIEAGQDKTRQDKGSPRVDHAWTSQTGRASCEECGGVPLFTDGGMRVAHRPGCSEGVA